MDVSALVAAALAAQQAFHDADAEMVDAFAPLRFTLTSEMYAAFLEHDAAAHRFYQAEQDLLIAEIARHLPGLAPTIYALVDHILGDGQPTGECCQ